jgi:hypothetical protein
MNGSGFVEMLARQMTAELRAGRDATPPGSSTPLFPEHSVTNRRVGPFLERFRSQNHKSLLSRRLGLLGSPSSLSKALWLFRSLVRHCKICDRIVYYARVDTTGH